MKSIPPKRKSAVNGEILEYVIAGSGSPAIVLVNGSGGPIEDWYKVLASLAALGTVFAYNRPGISGGSMPAEVSGIVLLEATAPEDVAVMAEQQTRLQRFAQRMNLFSNE